jgi:hypothetical protein
MNCLLFHDAFNGTFTKAAYPAPGGVIQRIEERQAHHHVEEVEAVMAPPASSISSTKPARFALLDATRQPS